MQLDFLLLNKKSLSVTLFARIFVPFYSVHKLAHFSSSFSIWATLQHLQNVTLTRCFSHSRVALVKLKVPDTISTECTDQTMTSVLESPDTTTNRIGECLTEVARRIILHVLIVEFFFATSNSHGYYLLLTRSCSSNYLDSRDWLFKLPESCNGDYR